MGNIFRYFYRCLVSEFITRACQKIIKSYQKGNTLYMSMSTKEMNDSLNTGSKFWKALSLYDNILISASAYGFSKKNSNYSSYRLLEEKLKSVVNSIEINKST